MSRILLLIDDEPDIMSLFRRVLRRSFDEIGVEARQVLEQKPVTHVVSDFFLGADEAKGTTLLAGWRTQYPSLRFAAIFTGRGAAEEIDGQPGVDAVYSKPTGFEDLVQRLQTTP
jgi:DNA-binding NtrC family response regulator